ncbi:hypothetical protein K0C01_08275 [Salinarchaeum sp. IM2453]|uniref:hypothetical protein n=1 Tax=Salinarchaeum sp. IM2453 TaxID=2862870 RepID=UPI001C831A6D|nr:hypothetical protein [Salinarchaeum sp. IM2453]QZA87796.1 hypothetical protein K0C01_08275 [Salinarchaeum sp. IM2453]
MIVVDTSALITISSINLLDHVLTEYDIYTTETVIEELKETAEYNDVHGQAAQTVLDQLDRIEVDKTTEPRFQSSRIDDGEGSTVTLASEKQADFLITDDLRALPELQTVTDSKVVISPILLKALVKREILEEEEAVAKLEEAAKNRDCLESPIYRKAKNLFE